MTNEENELLLKVLCAMLPYGVKIQLKNTYNYHNGDVCKIGDFTIDEIISVDKNGKHIKISHNHPLDWSWNVDNIELDDIKLYLRPMSSMTEEEFDEFSNIIIPVDGGKAVVEENKIKEYLEFCYSHHLDIFGLITKGLALEASEGMY